MEAYPFLHRNLFFNIITEYDLTFKEIRGILDTLLKKDAFHVEDQNWEGGKIYDIDVDHVQYIADVNRYEVAIYKRTEVQW